MARIDDKLAGLAAMSATQLRTEWEWLHGAAAPTLPETLLRMGVAYRLQEKTRGALPAMIARELLRMRDPGSAKTARQAPPPSIGPGTRLVRSWNARTIDVLAVEGGFLFEDRQYSSLTAIARAVTGARWSGPRFFGLTAHG